MTFLAASLTIAKGWQRHAIDTFVDVLWAAQPVSHNVLQHDEGSPQPTYAFVECAPLEHVRKHAPTMFIHPSHNTALTIPRYPFAPLPRERYRHHFTVTQARFRSGMFLHFVRDMLLVTVIHYHIQFSHEGFYIHCS